METQNNNIRISVRSLVEFLLRSGSLDTQAGPSSEAAMLEGARIHRALQKKEGEGYRAEVSLRMDVPVGRALVRLEGRADGIYQSSSDGLWTIDEIKTVFGSLRSLEEPKEVHLAQAACYAYMYACREGLSRMKIRMTYCSQATGEVRRFYEERSFEELKKWFEDLIGAYEPWAELRVSFDEVREQTIHRMVFPFPYREGQYDLAAGVYRTIVHEKKLFLQAPTGTGKTMAVLFPALKAIGEGKAERIFYLTAKGVTGAVALEALSLLHDRGLSVRSLALVSKERACPCEQVDCRPEACPRADGHFDRVNAALRELLQEAGQGVPMTAQAVAECARRHRVCPYSLSLDAAEFADVIICDYNYVFHPQARLTRFFEGGKNSILLIDEAHNLLERGRDMYSAQISYRRVRQFRRSVKTVRPRLWKKMKGLVHVLRELEKETVQENQKISVLGDWTLPQIQAQSSADASDGAAAAAAANALALDGAAAADTVNALDEGGGAADAVNAPDAVDRAAGAVNAADTVDSPDAAGALDAAAKKKKAEAGARSSGDKIPARRAELLSAVEEVRDQIQWILEQENRSAALYGSLREADPVPSEEEKAGKGPAEAAGMPEILEFYFDLSHFARMLRDLDDHYIVYAEKGGAGASRRGGSGSPGGGFSLHLYCADPSGHLLACMEGVTSAIYFSATFLPIQYYKGLLGGRPDDFEMYARSSFTPEQRKVVIVRDVTSRYRDRNEDTYMRIAGSIGRIVTCRPGNYMVYFPSYAFLENVLEAFRRTCRPAELSLQEADHDAQGAENAAGGQVFCPAELSLREADHDAQGAENAAGGQVFCPAELSLREADHDVQRAENAAGGQACSCPVPGKYRAEEAAAAQPSSGGKMFVLAQKREMTDAERAAFLEAFEDVRTDRHLIGFCVLGGMFGEGIDLRSDRLIGSLIVGTGIPPVEPQRELLREYFTGQGRNGYDFAYRYPGMNKVLQAAGRVIRTAEDIGIVVLMDGRFSEGANRELFPLEWGQPEAVGSGAAAECIRRFWDQFR